MIFICEDDLNIQELVVYSLEQTGFNAQGFDNATKLYQALAKNDCELILLDIMLPDESGLDVLKKLKKDPKYKNIPIIMLTAKSSEYDKVLGLDLGADDYVAKPFGIMEFNARVNALLRRTKKNDTITDLISVGNITIDNEKRTVTVDGEEQNVTFKEYELLKYLMINRGIVLSRDKIMEAVWGFDFQGESRTVDMHIKTLRQKLGESGRTIKTVRNVGYRMETCI